MKKLIVLCLLLSVSAFTQEKVSEKLIKKESYFESDGSSRGNRLNQKFEALFNSGFSYLDFAVGLTAGYYLSPNNVLELEYISVREDENNTEYRTENESLDAVSLGVKYFTSNSFYIKPALFYVKYSHFEDYRDSFSNVLTDLKREDLGLGFSLGNQWQWDNLTIGGEWFGIQRGLVRLSRSGEDRSIFKEKTSKNWLTVTLAQFNIGASF